MTESGADLYAALLGQKVADRLITPTDSVLVQFAGSYDESVCANLAIPNCTFANIAPQTHSTGVTAATRFDAHAMPQADESFDHVIAHAGLHHCSRPHQALHEMYRLARKSVIFVENQDSQLMRLATLLKVVNWYELPAVVDGAYVSGGVDGTGVPNHIYRWTRRDLQKTVASFDPAFHTPIEILTEWNMAIGRVSSAALRQRLRLTSDERAAKVLGCINSALNAVARSQGNIFAAVIRKDLRVLQPWMADPFVMTH